MAALSPLDKLMPRGYVRQVFCFPSTHHDVVRVLKAGLAGVVSEIPYLLSGISTTNKDQKQHISLTDPYQTLENVFSKKDLFDIADDYATVREGNFSPSAFSIPDMIPPDTQPPFPSPAPVFRVRVSLIKGGFVLCVAVHHCTTDITGFGALLKIWASHCRTGVSSGFDPSWLDRQVLFKRPDGSNMSTSVISTPMPELLHVKEPVDFTRAPARPTDPTTCIFFFPQKNLKILKDVVNEHIVSQGIAGWVSTGDILTALLWSAVVAAELDLTSNVKGDNTVGIPVNFRSRFNPPLSPDFLGAAFVMTAATSSLSDLVSFAADATSHDEAPLNSISTAKLAQIASAVRSSIHHVDEASVLDVLMYLNTAPADHPPITLGPRHDGISLVSWADQSAYELDWGDVVGRCDAVRLPKLMVKRYPIVLPRVPVGVNGSEGGLEVIVSFDRQVMEKFQQSWPIKRWATLRCQS